MLDGESRTALHIAVRLNSKLTKIFDILYLLPALFVSIIFDDNRQIISEDFSYMLFTDKWNYIHANKRVVNNEVYGFGSHIQLHLLTCPTPVTS